MAPQSISVLISGTVSFVIWQRGIGVADRKKVDNQMTLK